MRDFDDESAMHNRIADLEARLQRMERDRSMSARSRSLMSRIVPPEASQHFRAASREQLMGVRALMDHWIGRLDAREHEAPTSAREEIRIE
jgi:hypothetical protein